jgi:RHS repeat-associated protein
MAGDQFNIRVSSWYKKNGLTPGTPVSPLTALISDLINSIGGVTTAAHGATVTQLQNSGVIIPGANTFYNSHNTADSTTKPKAFINWVLLDDQFKYVASSSGFEQVGADQEFKVHVKNNMPVAKNGYLYVYVSNETPNINVYFDNLQVTHLKGPLLQEQSYYPFGLQMAGISDKAMNKLDSKNKFNGGVELEEDYGVNLYYTDSRNYDPQLGRFMGVDALSEQTAGLSAYHYGANNPLLFNDPSGAKFLPAFLMEESDRQFSQIGEAVDGMDYEMNRAEQDFESYYGGGGGQENQQDYTQDEIDDFWSGVISLANGGDGGGTIVGMDGKIISEATNNSLGVFLQQSTKDGQGMDEVSYKYLGTLGGVLQGDEIIKNLLQDDIDAARSMSPSDFKATVEDNAAWDYKVNLNYIYGVAAKFDKDNSKYGFHTQFLFDGYSMTAENFGNFHYGVVGLAEGRFTETILFMVAGAVQIRDGHSQPEWENTTYWGDDPNDHYWIQQGFNYYHSHQ